MVDLHTSLTKVRRFPSSNSYVGSVITSQNFRKQELYVKLTKSWNTIVNSNLYCDDYVAMLFSRIVRHVKPLQDLALTSDGNRSCRSFPLIKTRTKRGCTSTSMRDVSRYFPAATSRTIFVPQSLSSSLNSHLLKQSWCKEWDST